MNPLDTRPRSVALIGLGPSNKDWIGERAKKKNLLHVDEVWGINTAYRAFSCDRIWVMDDLCNIKRDYPEWYAELKTVEIPIVTCREDKGVAGAVAYPLDEVLKSVHDDYFSTSVAYAIAYAIHIKVEILFLFGIDFWYPDASITESGLGGVSYWLGVARERGMKYQIPNTSTLLDANLVREVKIDGKTEAKRLLYGYDYNPQDAKRKKDKGLATEQEKIIAERAYKLNDPKDESELEVK